MLQGKNAVVTGCLRGIGRKTMEIFASEGANIWACCQNEDAEFLACVDDLKNKYGVWIKPVYFDLSDPEAIKTGMKQIMSDKLPVHALVNIAGMTHNALFHMTTMENFKRIFEIDFFSQMQITQFVSKLMMKYGGGSIVTISSISGIDGNPGQIAYSSAKGALIAATKTLAFELSEYNIRVNAVAPGVIDTAMTQGLTEDQRTELLYPSDLKRIGNTEEVAQTIAFLASDLSSYMTGQIIRVDGGIG